MSKIDQAWRADDSLVETFDDALRRLSYRPGTTPATDRKDAMAVALGQLRPRVEAACRAELLAFREHSLELSNDPHERREMRNVAADRVSVVDTLLQELGLEPAEAKN